MFLFQYNLLISGCFHILHRMNNVQSQIEFQLLTVSGDEIIGISLYILVIFNLVTQLFNLETREY